MSDIISHITIRGRVQGVGYRAWVAHEARARQLEGWVRNRRDGSVEAVFSGPVQMVSGMIAACRHWPSAARVNAVEEAAGNPDQLKLREAGERFSMLPTM